MKTEYLWDGDVYQGVLIYDYFGSGLDVFHPYIPLLITGQEPSKVTRQYFIDRGWSVPGEEIQSEID